MPWTERIFLAKRVTDERLKSATNLAYRRVCGLWRRHAAEQYFCALTARNGLFFPPQYTELCAVLAHFIRKKQSSGFRLQRSVWWLVDASPRTANFWAHRLRRSVRGSHLCNRPWSLLLRSLNEPPKEVLCAIKIKFRRQAMRGERSRERLGRCNFRDTKSLLHRTCKRAITRGSMRKIKQSTLTQEPRCTAATR